MSVIEKGRGVERGVNERMKRETGTFIGVAREKGDKERSGQIGTCARWLYGNQ